MVKNFIEGKAAINVFCEQNNIQLFVVDAGVNYTFQKDCLSDKFINAKINFGTKNYLETKAMSIDECNNAIKKGKDIIKKNVQNYSCNVFGFGEMGIGNTATASVLMSIILALPIADCVGKGTGITDEKLIEKINILKKCLDNYEGENNLESK